jgi:hypothetical protein
LGVPSCSQATTVPSVLTPISSTMPSLSMSPAARPEQAPTPGTARTSVKPSPEMARNTPPAW